MSFGREIIFERVAITAEVKAKQHIIDLIAVPWEQEGDIMWRGEVWHEVFTRGSFDGIEDHAGRITVNREHDPNQLVGKIVHLDPAHSEGLFARAEIARTQRGFETMELAEQDMLSASVGYYVKSAADVHLNRRSMRRRVNKAFLEHLGLVGSPTFSGARLVDVRNPDPVNLGTAANLPKLETPILDEFLTDPLLEWARDRKS